MDDPTLSDLLRQFGLSDKEVDTYLTLLEHGEAKASTIAEAAGVSKRYVYSISEKLEERGFVSVNDHVVPTTIRANPPEAVIETLSGNLDQMRPELEARYSQAAPQSDEFEVVKSRVTVIKRIKSLIGGAENELSLSIPYEHLPEVADELREAVDRDVFVLLVVTGVDPLVDLELDGVASVARAWRELMPTMVTADRISSLIAPTEMISRSNSGKQAIAFTQEQLSPVMVGSFFGNYWPSATEVYVTEPGDLPGTYTDFRSAVLQATLHLRAGFPVSARIRGRPVHSDSETTEIDGRIVEVRQGLLSPINNDFPVQNALVVETDDGTYMVGGSGAFVEDFEAEAVELYVDEDAETEE
ncbi:Sugar-specific transcriptional regulator TrmB [Halogranum rubrum]|uniref:Sugar-specific transcriptional regulator TrmB n=1 Tax=Halogranum rubrum TaxID=553466 RepID=A0A1I4DYP2_9EURY|nr:TrmB family transcriptional regulator sugar-binding domain-containing protein [Halogranum rubrum]SFK98748.1 Sugar-specific transcriptional regulator TrmB [Halogranum rubrum]